MNEAVVHPSHAQEMVEYLCKWKKGKSRTEILTGFYNSSNWQKWYIQKMFTYIKTKGKIVRTGKRDETGQVMYKVV